MRWAGFHFIEVGTPRVHVLAYDTWRMDWVIPCGKEFPIGGFYWSNLDLPLCRSCDRITRQPVPQEVDQ